VAAWDREEDSCDDITCIVVFFKRDKLSTNDPALVFNQQFKQEDNAFKKTQLPTYSQKQDSKRINKSRDNSHVSHGLEDSPNTKKQ